MRMEHSTLRGRMICADFFVAFDTILKMCRIEQTRNATATDYTRVCDCTKKNSSTVDTQRQKKIKYVNICTVKIRNWRQKSE